MASTEQPLVSADKSPNCVSQGAPSIIPSSSATFLDTAEVLAADADAKVDVSFSHVQLYVDAIANLDVYKELEDHLNQLAEHINEDLHQNASATLGEDALDVVKYRELYQTIESSPFTSKDSHIDNDTNQSEFRSQGRDVVRQLIAGLGFRITAEAHCHGTRSVLLTTSDPRGVQIVVTALAQAGDDINDDDAGSGAKAKYDHFDSSHLSRFFSAHSNRQGISVLAFEVTSGSIDTICQRYAKLHPKLLMTDGRTGKSISNAVRVYENKVGRITKILEVCAYYVGDVRTSNADVGTVLRFMQHDDDGDDDDDENSNATCAIPLPGLEPVEATFAPSSQAAYCDHWVSNVYSRTGFIDTLKDVLGFVPKVDFNAGVVSAGEAIIESTVAGNDSTLSTNDIAVALRDQSQVYLPINNALSEVGHVHGFLKEIGQGVQHVASRVADLPAFVQQGNDMRKITGEGFTFLNIPRSYYGVLMESHLVKGIGAKIGNSKSEILGPSCAQTVMEVCRESSIIGSDGAVNLDLSRQDIIKLLDQKIPGKHQYEYIASKDDIVDIILHSRYANLYSLLRDHLSEESYLKIVRNQILVDVQGEDLLLQIFTSNILQRNVGEEAPFFEFIQRVCSECRDDGGCPAPVKPGCGGFGIRNFLTLFLSIEVSKAMVQASQAKADGDEEKSEYAQRMVDLFTAQLDASNPILTEISDAMTLEGDIKMRLEHAEKLGDEEAVKTMHVQLSMASKAKADGNAKLMRCSSKYKEMMRKLRESRN